MKAAQCAQLCAETPSELPFFSKRAVEVIRAEIQVQEHIVLFAEALGNREKRERAVAFGFKCAAS